MVRATATKGFINSFPSLFVCTHHTTGRGVELRNKCCVGFRHQTQAYELVMCTSVYGPSSFTPCFHSVYPIHSQSLLWNTNSTLMVGTVSTVIVFVRHVPSVPVAAFPWAEVREPTVCRAIILRFIAFFSSRVNERAASAPQQCLSC